METHDSWTSCFEISLRPLFSLLSKNIAVTWYANKLHNLHDQAQEVSHQGSLLNGERRQKMFKKILISVSWLLFWDFSDG